jgi:hypothetical protein
MTEVLQFTARNLEDAIDRFKKLQIETATMEITVTTVYERLQ